MPKKEKIVLIDSSALIHRAFHALPALRTKEGQLVNATYGFTSTLLKVLNELKPHYVAAAFDKKGPTLRHKEYAEYKAQRPALPSELSGQIPQVKEVLSAFDIPIFEKEGYEADDLIGALAKKAQEKDLESIIVTGDLDTLQLVTPQVKVFTLKKGIQDTIIYDGKKVKERYGLLPSQLTDYKGIRGDPSDNIPGIPGLGPRSASYLILEFSSLENLYHELEKETKKIQKLPQKLKENLLNYKEQAFLSKKLATIQSDLPLKFNLEDCHIRFYDREKVLQLFQKLGFKSLLPRLPQEPSLFEEESKKVNLRNNERPSISDRPEAYKIIQNQKDFDKFLLDLQKQKKFSFDLETDRLDTISAKIVGLAFSFTPKSAYYLPLGHKSGNNLDLNTTFKVLGPILENQNIKKIGHNLKFEILVLENYDIELKGLYFDTIVASYLLHPESRAHDLDSVAFSELGVESTPLKKLIGVGKKQIPIPELPIEKLGIYACQDADLSLRLSEHFLVQLEKEKLLELFEKVEMPLISVLASAERAGVKLDLEFLEEMSKELTLKIEGLREKIYQDVGYEFNINSPSQLSSVLFEVLQIPNVEIKRTKTGISTAASELEKLKGSHPVIDSILEYRQLTKLKTTYLDALPQLVNPKTGRVHTNFNQTITATGRLSSSNPNLQNIPTWGEYGSQIREAFIAESGNKLISADYSQIELRIIASLSSDRRMLQAFEEEEDIHARTAAEVFGTSIEEVDPGLRRVAKTINFGIIYGMSPHGLSEALGISHEEASAYIEKYFDIHWGIKNYIEEVLSKVRQKGYAQTILGRKRLIPEINSSIFTIRQAAERVAINMPIQGTAADLIKMAMIEISNKLQATCLALPDRQAGVRQASDKAKMILQVHDELIFEVSEPEVEKVAKIVKQIMENVYKLKIPIKVEISAGDNWGELKRLEI